jgi:thymidylate synthase ThyX
MRTLAHAHYTFRKKLSHTADSQDQRHRTVPASRPLLSRTVPARVDVVEPELIRQDPGCHALFTEAVEQAWDARARLLARGVAPELALYVLPNALAVRFEQSGTLLDLLHKWTMRTCLNAQREIWRASMEEVEQVRAVHPKLVEHVGPPCFVRTGLARPRCTEGSHFCGVPVWRSFPDTERCI